MLLTISGSAGRLNRMAAGGPWRLGYHEQFGVVAVGDGRRRRYA